MNHTITFKDTNDETYSRIYRVNGWLKGVVAKHPHGQCYEALAIGLDAARSTKADAHRIMMQHLRQQEGAS